MEPHGAAPFRQVLLSVGMDTILGPVMASGSLTMDAINCHGCQRLGWGHPILRGFEKGPGVADRGGWREGDSQPRGGGAVVGSAWTCGWAARCKGIHFREEKQQQRTRRDCANHSWKLCYKTVTRSQPDGWSEGPAPP